MSREDRGFYYLGRYCYAHKLQGGMYSLYQGGWSGTSEHNTAGLEVVRDTGGNVMRFKSWEHINNYYKRRYA